MKNPWASEAKEDGNFDPEMINRAFKAAMTKESQRVYVADSLYSVDMEYVRCAV